MGDPTSNCGGNWYASTGRPPSAADCFVLMYSAWRYVGAGTYPGRTAPEECEQILGSEICIPPYWGGGRYGGAFGGSHGALGGANRRVSIVLERYVGGLKSARGAGGCAYGNRTSSESSRLPRATNIVTMMQHSRQNTRGKTNHHHVYSVVFPATLCEARSGGEPVGSLKMIRGMVGEVVGVAVGDCVGAKVQLPSRSWRS